MKHILLSLTVLLTALACQPGAKQPPVVTDAETVSETEPAAAPLAPGNATAADSAAIADALHAFFRWYNTNQERLASRFDFVENGNGGAKLDGAKLAAYLDLFKGSGAVGQEFIDNETKFYRAAEKLWEGSNADEVLPGLDADRYWCAQDGEPQEFTTAPVRANVSGNRATVTLLLEPDGMNGGPREFEVTKTNGKWLVSKILCDMGVEE